MKQTQTSYFERNEITYIYIHFVSLKIFRMQNVNANADLRCTWHLYWLEWSRRKHFGNGRSMFTVIKGAGRQR